MAFLRTAAAAALFILTTAASSSKRGLCFIPRGTHPEDNSIWTTQSSSMLTWYYNYGPKPTKDYKDTPNFEFVPMLWGQYTKDSRGIEFIDIIRQQIKDGSNITHVLGFNEPDGLPEYGGSSMQPRKAAEIWIKQLEPLKRDGVKLGAPAVTGSPMGA